MQLYNESGSAPGLNQYGSRTLSTSVLKWIKFTKFHAAGSLGFELYHQNVEKQVNVLVSFWQSHLGQMAVRICKTKLILTCLSSLFYHLSTIVVPKQY